MIQCLDMVGIYFQIMHVNIMHILIFVFTITCRNRNVIMHRDRIAKRSYAIVKVFKLCPIIHERASII